MRKSHLALLKTFLLVRYELTTAPCRPTTCWRREMRMAWSMVSNAVVRFSNTKTTDLLHSRAPRMSLLTLSSADLVLCLDLKPDWNLSPMSCHWRWDWSWEETSFFINLDRNDRWDIGRKLDSTSGSRLGLFLTMVCLRASGTVPKLRQVFMKGTREGPMMSLASFKILAGTASTVECRW